MILSALRTNPALLKLDLYCKGARLDDSCFIEEDGGGRSCARAPGLGSGLEVILPGGPVDQRARDGGLRRDVPLRDPPGERALPPAPRRRGGGADSAFAASRRGTTPTTSSGKAMTRIGTLQGTYLGIYQAKVCEYWTAKPQKVNCKFCSVGLNLGVDDADEKSVERGDGGRARAPGTSRASPTSTSTPATTRATPTSTSWSPTSCASRRSWGCWSASRRRPTATSSATTTLRADGREPGLVLLRDLRPPSTSRTSAPASTPSTAWTTTSRRSATARLLGRKGPRDEPWVTNGEIIAGLEPPASTIEAIDWITSVGAIPTVCVFRPLVGHRPREGADPPQTEDDGPGLPAALRGVHGARPSHRRRAQHPRQPGAAPRRVPRLEPDAAIPLQTLKLQAMSKAFGYRFGKRIRSAATA